MYAFERVATVQLASISVLIVVVVLVLGDGSIALLPGERHKIAIYHNVVDEPSMASASGVIQHGRAPEHQQLYRAECHQKVTPSIGGSSMLEAHVRPNLWLRYSNPALRLKSSGDADDVRHRTSTGNHEQEETEKRHGRRKKVQKSWEVCPLPGLNE